MSSTEFDRKMMDYALRLAARGLGNVWPNPAVGCVIVRNDTVAGIGWTQPGGRPHAETGALAMAGSAAQGATAYVTLEPCAHTGKTPPCADALIQAGICRVIVACRDPDPRVNGQGIERLRAASLVVEEGLCREAAEDLNAGFFKRVCTGLPFVTVKIAASLDGRTALPNGDSRWITNIQARQFGHYLRSTHDAIMVGTETVLRDNPVLSCRLPGLERRSPVRIVLDRTRRLPDAMNVFRTDVQETWLLTARGHTAPLGTRLLYIEEKNDRFCLYNLLKTLASEGITRLLAEGGSKLATSLLEIGLADTMYWFQAPKILGGQSRSALDTPAPPVVPTDVTILDTRHWGGNHGLLVKAGFLT